MNNSHHGDKEQQEVDFVIANEGEPIALIEARLADTAPSSALRKFQDILRKPAIQLVEEAKGCRLAPNGDQVILVAPACQWLPNPP